MKYFQWTQSSPAYVLKKNISNKQPLRSIKTKFKKIKNKKCEANLLICIPKNR